MKAAILRAFGTPLQVGEVDDPRLGTGEVIVDVVAAPVLSYTAEVFSGKRRYALELPTIPGCGAIGRVRAVGPDSTKLASGDWVFCDPTVRSRDDARTPDITLQGWSARGEGGLKLQSYFRDGPFASQMRVPTENAFPIGAIEEGDAGRWCALVTLLIAYGGLRRMELQAGETLLVSGATGNFGSAAIAIAIAMGAGCVLGARRNREALSGLERRFGRRLRPVHLTGDAETDAATIRQVSPRGIDAVLDFLPPSAPASLARTALMAVRPYGRAVLMGGVGMLGGEDLALPYPWIMRNLITVSGQWMYSREIVPDFVALVRSGLLPLEQFTLAEFSIDDIDHAIAHAATHAGPFNLTVVRP
ncbi:zinc-binding alcohol dehydrogenase family protein [Gluconacetobacter diazotrophicus]|uniref:Zinc-binding alcohol dehydrogenase family protein n=1 Tax=Gluconacetobacter diazotrophicus TaxID=33996 RepID=A0A7W4NPS0_GLUDI|nr:zinc-binding alcohol dehydrogenase family protein [Gluconacetobacter diazotrophicus]MBB2158400.1 zinc-binding alcohol dehydrogenase family protein [Gluconacetobacter diazotrophicus]